MKHVKISVVVLLLMVLVSCHKTENIADESSVFLKSDTRSMAQLDSHGFLVFDSREAFDDYLTEIKDLSIDQVEEMNLSIGFHSSKDRMENGIREFKNLNSGVTDEMLLSLVDANGLIQVGDNIFKVETDLGYCWTMNRIYLKSDYDKLIRDEFNPETMNRFSVSIEEELDIDIYEYLEKGIVGVDQWNKLHARGIFGDDHKPPPVDECSVAGICNRGDAKACYQNALVYKSLYTELKTYKKGSGSSTWTPLSTDICKWNNTLGNTNWTFTPRKLSQQSGSSNTCNNGYHHDHRPYNGTRRLTQYAINGNFRFLCPTTNVWKEHHAGVFN